MENLNLLFLTWLQQILDFVACLTSWDTSLDVNLRFYVNLIIRVLIYTNHHGNSFVLSRILSLIGGGWKHALPTKFWNFRSSEIDPRGL